jgi:regulatory protein
MNLREINMMEIPSDIMTKMERFCAWQERCENDVRRKLTSFRLSDSQQDAILKSLRANGFLDENRYVESFVRSKVKASWGRQKIVAALRAKGISSELIAGACSEISDDDYADRLRSAIEKWQRLHPDVENAREKLIRHLLSKGYSMGEVMKELAVSS